MSEEIPIVNYNLVDALYYFEYHGPLRKRIAWTEKDKGIRNLYKLIREIKFPRFKFFLPWIRFVAVKNQLDTPKKLAKYVVNNPPKGKYGEMWVADFEKMIDILSEIKKYYNKQVMTKEKSETLENLRNKIIKKYSKEWSKLVEEALQLPGVSLKRKEPMICLLQPLDGRLSHKLPFGDIAFIEVSEAMLEDECLFLHEVVKLLNYTKPIYAWVRQDRRGIRGLAYELYTENQTQYLVGKIFRKKTKSATKVVDKLDTIWIPFYRPDSIFDDMELERIISRAYEMQTNHEFDAMYQLGELYTELNIILLA
ncbi:MAG: hypothetical protein ACTSO7_09215 [Candidatus Heimdallarchaeota archaeon]